MSSIPLRRWALRLRSSECGRWTSFLLCQRRYKSGPYGYTQAKALVFARHGEPEDVLSLHTHSISPSRPAAHLLLRTLAAPINPSDINALQGTYASLPAFTTTALGTPEPTAVAGNEGVFEVVGVDSLGAGEIDDADGAAEGSAGPIRQGDWVIPRTPCLGTWRTHALLRADQVHQIDARDREGLRPADVATVGVNACTAYRLLKDFGGLTGGAWIVLNGANSAVGRLVLQLARLWGYRAVGVVRERASVEDTKRLHDELCGLGAEMIVTEEQLADADARAAIWKKMSGGGGRGARLGLNCVGGKPASNLVKLLDPSGGATLVTYGAMGRRPLQIPFAPMVFQDVRFQGFWVTRWSERNPEGKVDMLRDLLRLMRERKLLNGSAAREVRWTWDSTVEELRSAVKGALDGRKEKAIWVFEDT